MLSKGLVQIVVGPSAWATSSIVGPAHVSGNGRRFESLNRDDELGRVASRPTSLQRSNQKR